MAASMTLVELCGGPLDGEVCEVPDRCACCGESTEAVGSVLELCEGSLVYEVMRPGFAEYLASVEVNDGLSR
jgi:hypothetical protein